MFAVSARSEVEGIISVRFFAGCAMFNRDESGAAVFVGERFGEEAWRAGMLFIGAWPADAIALVDFGIGDAAVIGACAARSLAEFVEDGFGVVKREAIGLAQFGGQIGEDGQIAARARWRIDHAAAADDPAFKIGHRAFFFGELERGK